MPPERRPTRRWASPPRSLLSQLLLLSVHLTRSLRLPVLLWDIISAQSQCVSHNFINGTHIFLLCSFFCRLQTTSSALKGAIQLGIGYTVGNLSSKPERDVLMQDFYVVESIFFPRCSSSLMCTVWAFVKSLMQCVNIYFLLLFHTARAVTSLQHTTTPTSGSKRTPPWPFATSGSCLGFGQMITWWDIWDIIVSPSLIRIKEHVAPATFNIYMQDKKYFFTCDGCMQRHEVHSDACVSSHPTCARRLAD